MLPAGDDGGSDDGEGGDCYAKAFAQAKAKASASGDGNAKAEAKAKAEAQAKCKGEDKGNDDEGNEDTLCTVYDSGNECGAAWIELNVSFNIRATKSSALLANAGPHNGVVYARLLNAH